MTKTIPTEVSASLAWRLASLVEPLCEATGQIFTPIVIRENEFLEIGVDKKQVHFVVQARCLKLKEDGEPKSSDDVQDIDGRRFVRTYQTPSDQAARVWAERCPERKELGYGRYQLGCTDFSAIVIAHSWPMERIVFLDEFTRLKFTHLVARFVGQKRTATILARWRIEGKPPEVLPEDYVPHPEVPLSEHQLVPLAAFCCVEGSALLMDTGVGKTPISVARTCLEAAMKRRSEKERGVPEGAPFKTLVICPPQVRTNWQEEVERFATSAGKVAVLRGDLLPRARILYETIKQEPGIDWATVICSIDSVDSSLDALRRVMWDLVILDESHYAKNKQSVRFKSLVKIRDECSRQRMILTATPIANTVFDLWAQLEFLGEGMSGFTSFEAFRGFHGKFKQVNVGGTSIQKLVAVRNLPLLQERLARMACIMSKTDAKIKLPPKTYSVIEIDMTSRQKLWYEKVRDELVLELADLDEKKLTADHVLTKLLRLAQITSGHVRWDRPDSGEGGPTVEQIPGINPKIEAIVEHVQDPSREKDSKGITWCAFREDIRALSARFTAEGVGHVVYDGSVNHKDRETAIEKFRDDPNCREFIGNPKSAGAGLNLLGYDPHRPELSSTYCDQVRFFSQGWSATERMQAEGRAFRTGTRRPVHVTDFVVLGSIDQEIRSRVLGKLALAAEVQDVREILRKVLGT